VRASFAFGKLQEVKRLNRGRMIAWTSNRGSNQDNVRWFCGW